VLARGRIVTVREDMVALPDGEVVSRELVEHPGAVAVVALDELDRVLMIPQYRHPVELVQRHDRDRAGMLDQLSAHDLAIGQPDHVLAYRHDPAPRQH